MNAFETGKAWAKSVTPSMRRELLKRASGRDSASELKLALIEAERNIPDTCEPFRIKDWPPIDGAWISEFCDGVRSFRGGADTEWR